MEELEFSTAFKYPFNRFIGLFNIFWVLLPIIGWFALGGYGVRIIQEFVKGNFGELPLFNFIDDMKLGFVMFIKGLPFFIVLMIVLAILSFIPYLGKLVYYLISFFVVPVLMINFMNKMTVESAFEFSILTSVSDNLGDYIVAFLKDIVLAVIFIFMCIVLVGFPALAFTKSMFIADFYRRHI